MNRIALLLFLTAFSAFAQVPPVLRNKFSTNDDVRPIVGGILFTNPVAGGGWILFDSGGLAVFDKNFQENGRIFGVSTGGVAMQFAAGFSGLFTNGVWVVHTRDGTKVPISIEGDFTSQTAFLIQAWTNSGTAQNVFTVDAGGKIYSFSLTANTATYTDSNTNLVSATTNLIAYAANTNTINFAATPYLQTTITNDTVFTNLNQQVGRSCAVLLTGNITNSNLSFPAGWQFIGSTAPTSITSNKVAVLSLTAFGNQVSNIIAVYAVQP